MRTVITFLLVQGQAVLWLQLPLLFEMWMRPASEVSGAWLGAVLGAVSGLGSLFGGGAKAAADSRERQAMLQLAQDRAKTDQYGIGQQAQMQLANTDLARKQFEESARGGRAKQAAMASMLAGFQPTSIDIPGIQSAKVSGGLSLGEGGKMAMAELMKQALLKQLSGDQFQGGQILQAPGVQGIPKAGFMEKLGGALGTIGGIAGLANQFMPQKGASVPGIPMAGGVPGQVPGTPVDLSAIPPDLLAEQIARINEITRRSGSGG